MERLHATAASVDGLRESLLQLVPRLFGGYLPRTCSVRDQRS